MFKQLRRKFVLINMSFLTFIFVIICIALYVLTALSGERQLVYTLNEIMNNPVKGFPKNSSIATSIIVELDPQNQIAYFFSFMDIEEETIEKAIVKALRTDDKIGKIQLGDFHYSFLKNKTPVGTKIIFVDRSPLQNTLRRILLISIFVGICSLGVLLLISIYLADRAINPIKEAFEKQEQFVADASHELKTPLAIIKTNLSVLQSNPNSTIKNQYKWLGYISSQTDRMTGLINDMLSLAKMESEQSMFFQNLNLSNLINGILLSFEAPLFENNLLLKTTIEEEIYVYGEKDNLERLISILVDNAIKNTPKEGIISVNLSSQKNTIELRVKNTGRGISPENIGKIFERFYRDDPSRARESGGFGLGLAIAKSIVQKHNGKIYAQSNVGKDTTFIVQLPKVKI